MDESGLLHLDKVCVQIDTPVNVCLLVFYPRLSTRADIKAHFRMDESGLLHLDKVCVQIDTPVSVCLLVFYPRLSTRLISGWTRVVCYT